MGLAGVRNAGAVSGPRREAGERELVGRAHAPSPAERPDDIERGRGRALAEVLVVALDAVPERPVVVLDQRREAADLDEGASAGGRRPRELEEGAGGERVQLAAGAQEVEVEIAEPRERQRVVDVGVDQEASRPRSRCGWRARRSCAGWALGLAPPPASRRAAAPRRAAGTGTRRRSRRGARTTNRARPRVAPRNPAGWPRGRPASSPDGWACGGPAPRTTDGSRTAAGPRPARASKSSARYSSRCREETTGPRRPVCVASMRTRPKSSAEIQARPCMSARLATAGSNSDDVAGVAVHAVRVAQAVAVPMIEEQGQRRRGRALRLDDRQPRNGVAAEGDRGAVQADVAVLDLEHARPREDRGLGRDRHRRGDARGLEEDGRGSARDPRRQAGGLAVGGQAVAGQDVLDGERAAGDDRPRTEPRPGGSRLWRATAVLARPTTARPGAETAWEDTTLPAAPERAEVLAPRPSAAHPDGDPRHSTAGRAHAGSADVISWVSAPDRTRRRGRWPFGRPRRLSGIMPTELGVAPRRSGRAPDQSPDGHWRTGPLSPVGIVSTVLTPRRRAIRPRRRVQSRSPPNDGRKGAPVLRDGFPGRKVRDFHGLPVQLRPNPRRSPFRRAGPLHSALADRHAP